MRGEQEKSRKIPFIIAFGFTKENSTGLRDDEVVFFYRMCGVFLLNCTVQYA